MRKLTDAEAKILDDAEKLLINILESNNETIMTSLHGGWRSFSVTYFDKNGFQHSSVVGRDPYSFSTKIEEIIKIQHYGNLNAEKAKQERVATLKAELERLTGEQQ